MPGAYPRLSTPDPHHNTKEGPMATKKTETKPSFLADRKKVHGEFKIQADIAQSLKETARGRIVEISDETREHLLQRWETLPAHQREALDMILHKAARILAGDNEHDDHWRDIGGYAKRAEELCEHKTIV
jgi:hypothetical protein